MKNKVYGYARVSTMHQNLDRQIANIKEAYPEAIIITEKYTGTTTERPNLKKLLNKLNEGDCIVFDEVSRMSRNADEGFKLYEELYTKGINLIFIKTPLLNTDIFKNTLQIATIGNEIVDPYIEATNKVLMILAKQQIQKAFEAAQIEVDTKRQAIKEGIKVRKEKYDTETALGLPHEKEKAGRVQGKSVTTKKSIAAKEIIKKHSRDFNGTLTDIECMKQIGNISRNSFYKYKRELAAE